MERLQSKKVNLGAMGVHATVFSQINYDAFLNIKRENGH